MKKIISFTGSLMLFCGISYGATVMPLDDNGKIITPEWQGCIPIVQTSSTSAKIVTGKVLVDWVSVSSGSAGDYAVVADSGSTSGITTTYTTTLIYPWVYTNANTGTSVGANMLSPYRPPVTTNGLVVLNSAANMRTVVCYRIKR